MVYVSVFSVSLLVLDHVDLSWLAYATDNGTSTILGPLVAGLISGACYSLLVRGGALTGGVDFVASLIHKRQPETNLFWLIFLLNCTVATVSFFVYGYKLEPVILCVLYSFMSSTVSDRVSKSIRSASEMLVPRPSVCAQNDSTSSSGCAAHRPMSTPGSQRGRAASCDDIGCIVFPLFLSG